jgi:hypothetical protein
MCKITGSPNGLPNCWDQYINDTLFYIWVKYKFELNLLKLS